MAEIRIAAALILDGQGRTLLVRKRGTAEFMQAGGKIEPGETPLDALRRELAEELGLAIGQAAYLGRFAAPAAHQPGCVVVAELFRLDHAGEVTAAAEIAEVRWVLPAAAGGLPLAPLTRDHVLPLARRQ